LSASRKHTAGFAAVAAAAAILAGGCAHHAVNAPLERVDPGSGYRLQNLEPRASGDRLFVILTFSGGGTRASALAYGVLKELAGCELPAEGGGTTTLLDEVDVISSVSGGSFTAAYYALFDEERLFSDYEEVFLRKNVQGALVRQLFFPWNWVRLASPHWDRIDLAAGWYDRNVFDGKTFDALIEEAERPYILMNATDMGQGNRFEFTQDQFDYLCSDLGPYPVARGVAASSAFPGLLTSITLHNHANRCGFRAPTALVNALEDREDNPRRFMIASELVSYLQESRPYLHLLDGGVADNIGLRGPYYALTSNDSPWSLVTKVANQEIGRIVVIVVNAKKEGVDTIDQRHNAPNLLRTLQAAASTPMAHYSFDTVQLLEEYFYRQNQENQLRRDLAEACPDCRVLQAPGADVSYSDFQVSFERIEDETLRTYLQGLPTSFKLDDEAVDALIEVGPTVLGADEDFQALIEELGGRCGEGG
jgi:NTE family protein